MGDKRDSSLVSWSVKDMWFMVIFAIQFVLIYMLSVSPLLTDIKTVITLFLAAGMFTLTITWYKEPLKKQWRAFRANHFWKKIILAVVLTLGIFMLLQLTRSIMPSQWLGADGSFGEENQSLTLFTMFVSLIVPLFAPFSEEILFRYIFIGKVDQKWLQVVMLVVQAVLFGLIHTMNFGGNPLATIPYMVIAFYFGIIYLISKNIWLTMIVHFLFNASGVVVPLVMMIMLLFK